MQGRQGCGIIRLKAIIAAPGSGALFAPARLGGQADGGLTRSGAPPHARPTPAPAPPNTKLSGAWRRSIAEPEAVRCSVWLSHYVEPLLRGYAIATHSSISHSSPANRTLTIHSRPAGVLLRAKKLFGLCRAFINDLAQASTQI